ncbi:MAG TPA: trypsin-like peptidase domain-containing protein [Methylotenera sp.]|nr:trypsin-like peptidase domain-containing protein [Methylotenera sp.]
MPQLSHKTLLIALVLPLQLVAVRLAYAQAPKPEFVLALSHSIAKVHIEDKNGQHGIGSGVVVAVNHVATNCHVIANARGVAVNKLGNSYAPIALKADWRHDLCILKFDDLPLTPFPYGVSANLQYEQHILALGYSGNSPRPVESFGTVKALIPLDDSNLIRTTAGFRMGASGGALLDYEGNLVGFTTFKSPGRNGYYYSLPVEWVKKLLEQPDIALTTQTEQPFWDVPEKDRPFFMQVVQPLQTEAWSTLELISKAWTNVEKDNPEAWLYLGMAQQGLLEFEKAKQTYNKVLALAPKHSSAFYQLGVIAMAQGDKLEAANIGKKLESIDPDFAEDYNIDVGLVPKPEP